MITDSQLNRFREDLEHTGLISSIGLVAYGGSIAYGLATPESDVDLRGFALPTKTDILLMRDFEQIQGTSGFDSCIYSLSKACYLLLACNPNMVELLGLDEDAVLISSPAFEELIQHPEWFLSKRAAHTFGGYATAQLRRIQNAMSRDGGSKRIAQAAMRSLNAAIDSFPDRYPAYRCGECALHLDESTPEQPHITVDFHLEDFPATELRSIVDELDAVNKQAILLGKNRRKEDSKLSKHASHLLRLLRMGTEILADGCVKTRRDTDAELLLDIKRGKYLVTHDDGIREFEPEFWELLDEAERAFDEAEKRSPLPEEGDRKAVEKFIRRHHFDVIR